jgi:anti-sigma regulatory factor (Ser/Thr protein kinase)
MEHLFRPIHAKPPATSHNVGRFNVNRSRTPCFFTAPDTGQLSDILLRPFHHFIEICPSKQLSALVDIAYSEPAELFLSISTHTAYHCALSSMLTHVLGRRFGLQDGKSLHIATCLQEALTNAIIHGNLSIGSNFSDYSELQEFHAQVEHALITPAAKLSRITIRVYEQYGSFTVSIGDEGKGFDFPSAPPANTRPSGRGLYLIQSLASKVWLSSNRRTLFMNFHC